MEGQKGVAAQPAHREHRRSFVKRAGGMISKSDKQLDRLAAISLKHGSKES
ncbi:hypothetical protein PbJCM17693_47840 [Paenibacillus macerans]|nr:hypothetical protein PbJCM17693_47840 [Paenibacillus macerans]